MSNEEIIKYSQEYLLYLSLSPLVPQIDLSTAITFTATTNPTSSTTPSSSTKKKKSKKEEWILQEERFTFDAKGTNAIEEFKLMMKSKEAKSSPVKSTPLAVEEHAQLSTRGGKSRFLKFFDESATVTVPVKEMPPPVQQVPIELSQEQLQFQRVMAMLARSSINPSDPHVSSSDQPLSSSGQINPFGPVNHMNGPAPQHQMPHMGYQPSFPLSSVSFPSSYAAPKPVAPNTVPMTAAHVTAAPSDPSNTLNAMLQSSIKAKRMQTNDLILEQFNFKNK